MEFSKLQPRAIYGFCLLLTFVTSAAPRPATGETRGATTKVVGARSWTIRRQPVQLVNGAPLVIEVVPPVRLTALSAKWLEHEVLFSYDAATKAWHFNWKTSGQAASCYNIYIESSQSIDGTVAYPMQLTK